jgi:hypothetical protein
MLAEQHCGSDPFPAFLKRKKRQVFFFSAEVGFPFCFQAVVNARG